MSISLVFKYISAHNFRGRSYVSMYILYIYYKDRYSVFRYDPLRDYINEVGLVPSENLMGSFTHFLFNVESAGTYQPGQMPVLI